MKLSFKSLLSVLLLFFLVGAVLIFVKINQENFIKNTFTESSREQKKLFKTIFDLYEERIKALSIDYTYWDEMVNFVKTGDEKFAENNLKPGLTTYGADWIWVYDTKNQLVYSVGKINKEFVVNKEFSLNLAWRQSLFQNKRLVHFFVKTESGILDVFGATIHPSNDSERVTDPQGYFYTAKLLDNQLLNRIGEVINSKVSVEDIAGENFSNEFKDPRQGKFTFFQSLLGFSGQPIAQLKIESQFGSIKEFSASADRDFLIFFALSGGFLISVFLVIYLQDRSVEHAMRIAEVMTANLTESEARFRAMNDASPFGIFVTDPKGKCIYSNAAYQKVSQQTSEESWGDGWIEIIHPEDKNRVYAQWYQAVSSGGEFNSEHRLKLKDGKEIWVNVKAASIRVEDKLLGYIGVVEEIAKPNKRKTASS